MGILRAIFGSPTDLYELGQHHIDLMNQMQERNSKIAIELDAKMLELLTKPKVLCHHHEIFCDGISIRCGSVAITKSQYCDRHDKYWRGE